eukprot:286643-Rhodomonas_salina.1
MDTESVTGVFKWTVTMTGVSAAEFNAETASFQELMTTWQPPGTSNSAIGLRSVWYRAMGGRY